MKVRQLWVTLGDSLLFILTTIVSQRFLKHNLRTTDLEVILVLLLSFYTYMFAGLGRVGNFSKAV